MELTLRILSLLSGTLDGARHDVATAEALPLLLAATGSVGGAVYLKRGDKLELSAASGLPADLRRPLARLDLAGPAWFIAQRAAATGALVVAPDLAREGQGRLEPGALSSAGWGTAAAYPIAAGDELLGVVVIAAPAGEEISREALTTLEVGSNTLAFYLSLHREALEDRGMMRPARVTAAEDPTLPGGTLSPMQG